MPSHLTEHRYTCHDQQRDEIHKALIKEYEALTRKATEQKIKLQNGILQQTFADKYIYKFPLPKEPERQLEPDKPYILSIDSNTIKGNISTIIQDKSEVEIELYENKGEIIPVLDIIIDLKVLIDLIDRRIVTIDRDTTKYNTETSKYLFNPNNHSHVIKLTKQLNHIGRKDKKKLTKQQISAVDAALSQKLSIIWGPPGTGKTITLQGVIAELLSNGHKVLFASNTNNAIDGLLKGLVNNSPYEVFTDLKKEGKIIRIGSQTNIKVKEHFGISKVTQNKSQDIQDHIIKLQLKIKQSEDEIINTEEEIKKFEYGKYLVSKIHSLEKELKSIPSNAEIQEKIKYLHLSKEKIFSAINKSKTITSFVANAKNLAEEVQTQKTKVAGLNANEYRLKKDIELKEIEIQATKSRIKELEKAFLGSLRNKKKIQILNEKLKEITSQKKEHQATLEIYTKQHVVAIETESELTGKFIKIVNSIIRFFWENDFDLNNYQNYFKSINLSIKPFEKKPSWIILGIEYGLIDKNLVDDLYMFISLRKINQKTIINKYEDTLNKLQSLINTNLELKINYENKIKLLLNELPKYKTFLEKSESYWDTKKEKISQIKTKINPLKEELDSLKEKIRSIERTIIKDAKFICCTLVKASYDESLSEIEFDSLVIDETSMISLPQLYCVSTLVKDRIILCGDHLQLQPISTSESNLAIKWLASSYYDFIELSGRNNGIGINSENNRSTVKRVIKLKKLKDFQTILSIQHRMPPKIADLIRVWYKKAGNNLTDAYKVPEQFSENIGLFSSFQGHFLDNDSVFFIDTSSIKTYHSKTSDKSPYNLINAAIIAEITRELVEDYNINPDDIKCISPYRAQYQLTSLLLSRFLPNSYKDKIDGMALSVHKMQGTEAPIIFYDLTDGHQSSCTYFFKTEDLHIHNVAISRSQLKLIFVGDLLKLKKLKEKHPESSINDITNLLLSSHAKIIDAKPIKEKIFKQYNEKDLIADNTIKFNENQRNKLIILPSPLYYRFLKKDIEQAKHSLLIISPFVTKARWNKIKNTVLNFKNRPNGVVTIITRPPDKMFGGNTINMAAVAVLNEFLEQGFIVKVSSNIHSKLVVIDRGKNYAIAYWGSLNPLSFNSTDEINTRLMDKEISEKLINMSLIGNIYPYRKKPFNKENIADDTVELVRKQLKEFRWTLAGFYGRMIGAICSNETIEKIIEILPSNVEEYKMIPQFNRRNFVLWNHINEIEEIILPLRSL